MCHEPSINADDGFRAMSPRSAKLTALYGKRPAQRARPATTGEK
jgi:hypothetical protein